MSQHIQEQVHAASLDDPEAFWSHQGEQLHWHKKPSRALARNTKRLPGGIEHAHWTWFPDGEISTSYNCLDRHVHNGHGDATAIVWDSPVSGSKQMFTYREVLEEVEVLAGVLREEGVRKGDVVLIYMPMIPAVVFAMLAIGRIGAIFTAVFGGFSSPSLAQRIEASEARVVLTASCGIEGNKGPIAYQPLVTKAVERSSFKPEKVIIWQRDQLRWDPVMKERGERNWQRLVKSARNRGLRAAAVPVKSEEGIYIIYTSGTTGSPKGVLREAGGHAVALNFSIKYCFGISRGDVMFTASDTAWVVGTSYIVFAPLLAGATTILFEGKPVGTPDAGAFWRIVAENNVKTMFTSPTALRAIRTSDSENNFFKSVGAKGGLRGLKTLFVAGERSEPSLIKMYQDLMDGYCAGGASVVDNWWSSETGSPITAVAQIPAAGRDFRSCDRHEPLRPKPGSAGKPMPGFDVRIVNDGGEEVPRGSMGNIVLGIPLAPSAFTTLFKDEERFWRGYLKRFDGRWIDTGDAGMIDSDGFVHVMSRADDIINVAAHRLSTGAIEQAIASHRDIAECCVVGIPDALKGHLPFAFVSLSTSNGLQHGSPPDQLFKEVQDSVREDIGPIASLGGMVVVPGLPRTRSGKTLRRVLRELVENAVHGEVEKDVQVPPTIEDPGAVDKARAKIKEYFEDRGKDLHRAVEARSKL